MIKALIIFWICSNSLWATKKFSRKTGFKCIECHRSKKGGDKNLKKQGERYQQYLSLNAKLRKNLKQKIETSLTESEQQILNYFKAVHKKASLRRKHLKGK